MTTSNHEPSNFAPTEWLGFDGTVDPRFLREPTPPSVPTPAARVAPISPPVPVAPLVTLAPFPSLAPLTPPTAAPALAPALTEFNTGRLDAAEAPPFVPEAPTERTLRLVVHGFTAIERRLLEGTVRVSQRRQPRLELLSEYEAARADIAMIDGADPASVAWFDERRWPSKTAVIWVDSRVARAGHTLASRPVQWPILPMILARALEQAAQAPASLPAFGRRTSDAALARPAEVLHVLVIDDSLAVRNHLRSLLEARGMRVSEADCVAAGVAAVETQRFGCVLMDVLMPDLDGYEGCRRIKGLKARIGNVPVVMLTSKSSPFDRIRGKMAGCDAYLTKPVATAQLFEVLAQHARLVGPQRDAVARAAPDGGGVPPPEALRRH